MIRKTAIAAVAVFLGLSALQAHDMFLKLKTHFLPPHTNVSLELINGTFEQSENAVARNRMVDVTIAGSPAGFAHPDTTAWHDENDMAILLLRTGDPGTYTVGVSTAPNFIDLTAEEFNEYLEHDGVLDVLEQRRMNGTLQDDARERYSKHVKAVFQVGEIRTVGFGAKLNYPIEFVPQQNPYDLQRGDDLTFLVLLHGRPLSDQFVYASYEGYHPPDDQQSNAEAVQTRTNASGAATITLSESGRWYVRLIHMTPVNESEADYESLWATLTFEVR